METEIKQVSLDLILNEPQELVLLDDTRFKVLAAGRGFGKSLLFLGEIVVDMGINYTNAHGNPLDNRVWYIAPDLVQGREIFWDRVQEFLDPLVVKKNETRMQLNLATGMKFAIKGAENPDKLRGPYLTRALFDEMAFHRKQGYWQKIVRPMLDKVRPYGCGRFYSSPDGMDEFYDCFQRGHKGEDNWSSYQFTSLEGGFMDEETIRDAMAEMTYEDWRQEYFAEFIASSGRVYYTFDRNTHCRDIPIVPGLDIHWAWDFNITPSVHSVLSYEHKGLVYTFDEICRGETPDTVNEFMARYPKERIINTQTGELPDIYIYGDVTGNRASSGFTDYETVANMLINHGYKEPILRISTANPYVRDRTNSVNTKMLNAKGEVGTFIDEKRCPILTRDFEKVRRAPGGAIDKTTDPKLSHASDAFGYYIWQNFPCPVLRGRKRGRVEYVDVVEPATGYWV